MTDIRIDDRSSEKGDVVASPAPFPETAQETEPVGIYPWVVVGACCIGLWPIVFSLGAPGTWLVQTIDSLGGASYANWLPFVAQIVQLIIAPTLSLASDMFGRRWFVLWALVMGIIGSIVTARAQTMTVAIGGLTIAGCAFVAQSMLYVIASEVIPRRQRALSQAIINAFGAGIGGTMAVTIGGVFVARNTGGEGGWRVVYYFQAILFAIAAIIFGVVYRPPPMPNPQNLSVHQRIRKLDFLGSFLLAAAGIPLCMALVWGGNAYPWRDPHVIAPLVLGCVFTVALVVHQIWFEKEGLFHHGLFKCGRNFVISLALMFIEGMMVITFVTFYPMSTAILWESRPLLQGLRVSPLFICFIIFPVFWGWAVTKTKTTKPYLIFGYACFVAAAAGLSRTTPSSSTVALVYCILVGLGDSVPLCLLTVLAHFAMPIELYGLGTALYVAARCLGGVVGATINTAIFNSKITTAIPTRIAAAAIEAGASPAQVPDIIAAVAGHDVASLVGQVDESVIQASLEALQWAYATSFHYVWYALLPFCAISLIICLFIADVSHLMTDQVDLPLERHHHDAHHETTAVEVGTRAS